jgi:hypothetical protein
MAPTVNSVSVIKQRGEREPEASSSAYSERDLHQPPDHEHMVKMDWGSSLSDLRMSGREQKFEDLWNLPVPPAWDDLPDIDVDSFIGIGRLMDM